MIDFETLHNNCKGDKNVWIKIEQKHILVKILFYPSSGVGFCTEDRQGFDPDFLHTTRLYEYYLGNSLLVEEWGSRLSG